MVSPSHIMVDDYLSDTHYHESKKLILWQRNEKQLLQRKRRLLSEKLQSERHHAAADSLLKSLRIKRGIFVFEY
jgi:hypothetical protein